MGTPAPAASSGLLRIDALGLFVLFVVFDPRWLLAFEKGLHSGLTFFAGTGSRDGISGEFQRAFQGTRRDTENQFFGGGDRVGCGGEDLRNFGVDESVERELVGRDMLNKTDSQGNRSKEAFTGDEEFTCAPWSEARDHKWAMIAGMIPSFTSVNP